MGATIKDVAALAGVAVSTASYALNGIGRVSSKTRDKVIEAAKQLNYQKNGIASDLKRSKTNTIALLLSDLSGPYYSSLIKGVQEVSLNNGYDLIACSSIGGDSSTAVKFIKEKRVDGAIILAHNIPDRTILESAREGFPIVMLDRRLEHESVCYVEADHEKGGTLATNYLIESGHRQIAFVSGPASSKHNNDRYNGFVRAMNQHNLTIEPRWNLIGNFTEEGGYRAIKLMLAQGNLPEAVFFANDEMALGGITALYEAGLRVPEDISVIGFDDIVQARFLNPALTTVRQPDYEVGALAVHLIFQILKGESVAQHYTLDTELVIRGTVRTNSK
ncbi:LacI family DNA-binding transcriptional regulator [Paenibacillus wulumuqiensis]|uniref:LacI family DNA-binding transcriptional regulator n=1 Tax=Paenibacillus wulumuqiensis TaxID=1567107 RepID=UPI0006193CC9|nr:LacI family DNA-binding transcriptional regulator [Paenibacillus wulumuqiensis]